MGLRHDLEQYKAAQGKLKEAKEKVLETIYRAMREVSAAYNESGRGKYEISSWNSSFDINSFGVGIVVNITCLADRLTRYWCRSGSLIWGKEFSRLENYVRIALKKKFPGRKVFVYVHCSPELFKKKEA